MKTSFILKFLAASLLLTCPHRLGAALIDTFAIHGYDNGVIMPAGSSPQLDIVAHDSAAPYGSQLSATLTDNHGNNYSLGGLGSWVGGGYPSLGGIRKQVQVTGYSPTTYTLTIRSQRGTTWIQDSRSVVINFRPYLFISTEPSDVRAGSSVTLRLDFSCPLNKLGITREFEIQLRATDHANLLVGLPNSIRVKPTDGQTKRINLTTLGPGSAEVPIVAEVTAVEFRALKYFYGQVKIYDQPQITSASQSSIYGAEITYCAGGELSIRGKYFDRDVSAPNEAAMARNNHVTLTRHAGTTGRGDDVVVAQIERVVSNDASDLGSDMVLDCLVPSGLTGSYDVTVGVTAIGESGLSTLTSNPYEVSFPDGHPKIHSFVLKDTHTGRPAVLMGTGVNVHVAIDWDVQFADYIEVTVTQADGLGSGHVGRSPNSQLFRLNSPAYVGVRNSAGTLIEYSGHCAHFVSRDEHHDDILSGSTVIYTLKAYSRDYPGEPAVLHFAVPQIPSAGGSTSLAGAVQEARSFNYVNCDSENGHTVSLWYSMFGTDGTWTPWMRLGQAPTFVGGTAPTELTLPLTSGVLYYFVVVDPQSDSCGFVGNLDDPTLDNCIHFSTLLLGSEEGADLLGGGCEVTP